MIQTSDTIEPATQGQILKSIIMVVTLLIALLSIAAGAAKIALVPDEVHFLNQFGFTTVSTVAFGVIQVFCGLLLILPTTRLYGAVVGGLAFLLSAVLLLVGGNLVLAGVTLLPIALSGFIAYQYYLRQAEP